VGGGGGEEAVEEGLDARDDEGFEGLDAAFAEEVGDGGAARFVEVVVEGFEHGAGHGDGARVLPPGAFVAFVGGARGVDCVKVGGIVDVDVDRVDADNGAVLVVELFDFPDVLEFVGVYIVVEFVPEGQGCKLGWVRLEMSRRNFVTV
jgi:hypothetical protein